MDRDESELLLASYLDGRLDEAGRERLEAWLAADPEALALMLAARAALAEAPDEAAPASLIERARGVVRAAPAVAAQGWLDRLLGGVGGLLQPVGVAAALLLACAAGIGLGHSSFANLMSVQVAEVDGVDLGLAGDDFLL